MNKVPVVAILAGPALSVSYSLHDKNADHPGFVVVSRAELEALVKASQPQSLREVIEFATLEQLAVPQVNRMMAAAWEQITALTAIIKNRDEEAAVAGLAPGKYDEVLNPFKKLMERELHANSSKGDRPAWLAESCDTMILELYYHTAKLQKALKDSAGDAIAEHCADVANLAMMVADLTGALHHVKPGRHIEGNWQGDTCPWGNSHRDPTCECRGTGYVNITPMSPPPQGWVPCSPEWLKAGGDCACAPRWSAGPIGNHYHPKVGEHGFTINHWKDAVSAYDPVTKIKAQVERDKYRSLTVATMAAVTELQRLIAERKDRNTQPGGHL